MEESDGNIVINPPANTPSENPSLELIIEYFDHMPNVAGIKFSIRTPKSRSLVSPVAAEALKLGSMLRSTLHFSFPRERALLGVVRGAVIHDTRIKDEMRKIIIFRWKESS